MRTLCVLAVVGIAWVVASLLRLDVDVKLLLALTTFLLGVAVARPLWLRLKFPVQDSGSDRAAAAIIVGIAGIAFGALVGWELTATYRARQWCYAAVASSPGRHSPALAHTVTLPLGDVKTCGSLLAQ
jgi:hypothetical protein